MNVRKEEKTGKSKALESSYKVACFNARLEVIRGLSEFLYSLHICLIHFSSGALLFILVFPCYRKRVVGKINCSFKLAIIIPNINGGCLLVPGTPPF